MSTHDGDKGFVELSGAATSVAGDKFKNLQAWEETVISFDVIIDAKMGANAETSVTSLTIPAMGVVYGGTFHNLSQTSGRLFAYYK